MKPEIIKESKALWQLAWPVLIGQIATVGMSVTDVVMVGQYSKEDLAAAALGSSLWVIIMVTVVGNMVSINAKVSFEVGAKNFQSIPSLMRQSMWMALGIGTITCLLLLMTSWVFKYLSIEPSLAHEATQFVYVISLGMPAVAMFRALYNYSSSLNETKPLMFISIAGLIFNILANWLLIYGNLGFPEFGATGSALATALGMWFTLGLLFFWIRYASVYRETYPFAKWEAPNWGKIYELLRIGTPIGVTYFVEVSAFCLVGVLIAHLGVVQIAANQIALNYCSLLFMVPVSIGMAIITRVSQALGEGNPKKAQLISWLGIIISLLFSTVSASVSILFRDSIVAAYSSDPEVCKLSATLLLLVAIFQFSDGVQVTASNALRGYQITFAPMVIHLASFYLIAIPIGYIFAIAPSWFPVCPTKPMGAYGFWIGLTIGLTLSAVFQSIYLYYQTKKAVK